jgi:hypothetical protein
MDKHNDLVCGEFKYMELYDDNKSDVIQLLTSFLKNAVENCYSWTLYHSLAHRYNWKTVFPIKNHKSNCSYTSEDRKNNVEVYYRLPNSTATQQCYVDVAHNTYETIINKLPKKYMSDPDDLKVVLTNRNLSDTKLLNGKGNGLNKSYLPRWRMTAYVDYGDCKIELEYLNSDGGSVTYLDVVAYMLEEYIKVYESYQKDD